MRTLPSIRVRARQQAHQRAQGHALAGARLAEDAQHLARLHSETDPIDGMHGGFAAYKPHLEIAYLGQGAADAISGIRRDRLWPESGSRMWQAATCDCGPCQIPSAGSRRLAHPLGERATGVKPAAGRRVDRVGRIAGDRRLLDPVCRVHRWPRGEQSARVGVQRPLEDGVDQAESRRRGRDTSPAPGR